MKKVLIYSLVIVSILLLSLPSYANNLIYVKIKGGDSDIKSYIYSMFPENTLTTKKKYANYTLTIDIDTERTSSGNIYGHTNHVNGGTRYYNYEATISFYLENQISQIASGSVSGSSTEFSPYVSVRFRYVGGGYRSSNNYNDGKDNAIQDALDKFQPYASEIISYVNSNSNYQNNYNYNTNSYTQPNYNNPYNPNTTYIPQSSTTNTYQIENTVSYQETVNISSLASNSDINLSDIVKIQFYDAYKWTLSVGDIKQEKNYDQPTNVELVLKPETIFDEKHPNKVKLKITIYGINGSKETKTFDLIR